MGFASDSKTEHVGLSSPHIFCHNSILALKGNYWDGCRNWSVMVPVLFCTYFGVLYFTNESYKLPIFETCPLAILSWPSRAGGLTSCQWKYVRGVMLKSHRLRQTGIKEQRKSADWKMVELVSVSVTPIFISIMGNFGEAFRPMQFPSPWYPSEHQTQIALGFQPPEMVS